MKKSNLYLSSITILFLSFFLSPVVTNGQPTFCINGDCALNRVDIYDASCNFLETCSPTAPACCTFAGGYSAGTYNFKYSTSSQLTIWLLNYIWNGSSTISVSCSGSTNPCSGPQNSLKHPNTDLLNQNYPNPFNPSTQISYSIIDKSHIKLVVYDALGNLVKALVNEDEDAGTYSVVFNTDNLSSGIYYYTLETDKFKDTKKMLVVK